MLKKVLLLVVGLTLGVSLLAETKRVAILPSVDKVGNMDYLRKFQITKAIGTGITLTEGYEAYDRIDIDSILGEQKFQRSGMVTDQEIKKIGEMTGAEYVLISELVYDTANPNVVWMSAQFDRVETGEIVNSIFEYLEIDTPEKLKQGCIEMVKKLLRAPGSPDLGGGSSRPGMPNDSSSSIQTSGFVDMGLSVKWATCNVGASTPEGYGSLLTFDELSAVSIAKRRAPTDAEWTELRVNCSWEWTTQNGVNGMKVTSSYTGNSIFLPAAGARGTDGSLGGQGSYGYYWSSTAYFPSVAWNVYFNSGGVLRLSYNRSLGFSVRPVTEY